MTDILIVHVEAFRPKPGEVIVARVDSSPHRAYLERIRDQLRELYPDHRVVLLTSGISLEAVHADDAPGLRTL